ncbi:hypothetical protein BDK51DRAFT_33211 [Blyttiomyces helicus]|uniref:Uncharacterized protein n=1 Tax=Blyttiomyces helicus TaxID=388810 RepID=A0A4P9WK20_9FUNG|nr:hypothetical protein BDK51DRAFT_33211 [Blyttiomyces helicus]|eukprot:RKO92732.1 hypothetical protein BDK51DRAFT_33211 [Blyttiomyces helicus]
MDKAIVGLLKPRGTLDSIATFAMMSRTCSPKRLTVVPNMDTSIFTITIPKKVNMDQAMGHLQTPIPATFRCFMNITDNNEDVPCPALSIRTLDPTPDTLLLQLLGLLLASIAQNKKAPPFKIYDLITERLLAQTRGPL